MTVLAPLDQADALRRIWFAAGTSIGLRERQQGRWLLPRRGGTVDTPWGLLQAKQVKRLDGSCALKPEADDLQRLSLKTGCSLAALRAAAETAPFETDESWTW